jgi:hypothetical protein
MQADRRSTLRKYLAVWNGEESLETLTTLVTPDFIGRIGSVERDLTRLKEDIADYRKAAPTVRFNVEHQFGEGEYLATRVTAHATDISGRPVSITGLNISRWENGFLAEEWAVWENLPTSVTSPRRTTDLF